MAAALLKGEQMNLANELELDVAEHDDPAFVTIVARVLNAAAELYRPEDVYVVQIDHWFDHKWLGFSGCRFSQCGTWLKPLLRIPAFHPHRVRRERYYRRRTDEPGGWQAAEGRRLHTDRRINPQERPRLQRISPAGLFLWYSGGTRNADRASLMLYFGRAAEQVGWYASFCRRDGWRFGQCKGAPAEAIQRLTGEECSVGQSPATSPTSRPIGPE